jgi:hypothetical protein
MNTFDRLEPNDTLTRINIRDVRKGDLIYVTDEDGEPVTVRRGIDHPWQATSDAKQNAEGEWFFERAVPLKR